VESRRLYQSVARRLREAISAGRFRIGERLPAERDLAAEYGVSRPTIREATIALEVEGLVEVRLGSGIVVRKRPQAADAVSDGIGAFELTEARMLIEGEAAALAATTIGETELQQLDQLIAAMKAAETTEAAERHDRDFHLSIAAATGNAAMARTVTGLWDIRLSSPQCALTFDRARRGGSKPVVDEHLAIVDALRVRDPAAARTAMRTHLAAVIDHLLDTTEAEEIEKARAAIADSRTRVRRTAAV
jgi:GntR family transcriptional repressor for pyruvate dehydrogenase complex